MVVEKEYLLSTYWIQYDKVISCGSNESLVNGIDFNQYAPWDLQESEKNRSYTGCVSTAVSQMIYYHLMNDYLNDDISYDIKLDVLTAQDAYVSFAEIPALTLYIPFDGSSDAGTLSFTEINNKLSVFVPAPTDPEAGDYNLNSLAAADYIAAMLFTVGVLHQSKYSCIYQTGAIFSEDVFLRCGFKSAYDIDVINMDQDEAGLWVTENKQLTDEAIEIFIDNLENGNPVLFSVPGHAIVLDGYDSATDMFHLNYGMKKDSVGSDGKAYTRWYTRDEIKQLGTAGFVLDVSPVYQETFTVTDSRVFGCGTLFRVVQQAAAMQGANIIVFDDSLQDAGALELPWTVSLKDKTTISGFNMTVFASVKDIAEADTETEAARQDEDGSDSEENANENFMAGFYGKNGSTTDFTDFIGNVICSFPEKSQGAAFEFSDAVQLNISTSNANIFAGISQVENVEILEKMESGSLDELLKNSQKKVAIAGSDGDDKIILDNETLVIGNFVLADGHDSLTVAGNSSIYGDIDVGSGDNFINISAGSSIHGNLLGGAELYITLGGLNSAEALFDITGDAGSTLGNIISITIDATMAEADEYILFNQGNVKNLLSKLQIKGNGGIIAEKDGSIKWRAEGGYVPIVKENDDQQRKIIAAGETALNAEVLANEIWVFQDGSSATGSLSIAKTGEVKVMTGAEFIFDISSMEKGNKSAIIDNYSMINGTFHFAINISADQTYGNYLLAEKMNEWNFNTPIRVTAGELELGSFSSENVEKGFAYGDNHYSLVYNENKKSLSLVITSAFQSAVNEDKSIELSWHNPVGATGYFLKFNQSNEAGFIKIFSYNAALNIVAAPAGEYEWMVIAPGLDAEYRDGGSFVSEGQKKKSTKGTKDASILYQVEDSDDITDVFMAVSSGTWERGYIAQHVELPEIGDDCSITTQIKLTGKNRYNDIFMGEEGDFALLYLSDSENGDALFVDDVYSAFPDKNQCERLGNISFIYAGDGNDIIDLTSDKFKFSGEDIKVYGGDGDDVIWSGADTACSLYGDRGNDCLVGSSQNDCFIGGAGDDIMHGAGGSDVFAYGDPATWGNDIIYQLDGENDIAELYFEDTDLQDKIREENITGGIRFTVDGYENSSITFYGTYYSLSFGSDCEKLEAIVEGGGCGEYASVKIFEDKN